MAKKQTATSNQNVLGAIAYLFGFISGIILLIVEKNNKYVRFHAMQSTIVFLGIFVVSFVVEYIPLLNVIVSPLLWIVSLILWILLMVKAFQGETYKLPYVGKIAEDQLAKMK